jgi:heme-degrading monooxygenase HmoA
MLTEIVRIPVAAENADRVLAYLEGHAFFGQEALVEHRLYRTEDDTEVMVMIRWRSREEMQATTDNALSTAFREELAPLVAGPPTLSFYVSAD